jgi:hypothetical protein
MSLEKQPIPAEAKEDRGLIMVAKCQDCSWYSSLPSTTFRLAQDSWLFQNIAQMHEIRYNHRVEFKVK